jgi:hypothetical protein
MTITITPNDYKEVTSCREEYVQYIVDAFLSGHWREFRPGKSGRFFPTKYVIVENGKGVGFSTEDTTDHIELIYKCEVELAVKLLIQNGYSLYRWYDYGGYVAYRFDKSPRRNDKQKVTYIGEGDWSHLFL